MIILYCTKYKIVFLDKDITKEISLWKFMVGIKSLIRELL